MTYKFKIGDVVYSKGDGSIRKITNITYSQYMVTNLTIGIEHYIDIDYLEHNYIKYEVYDTPLYKLMEGK